MKRVVRNGSKIKNVNGRRKVVPRAEGILVQINYFVFYFLSDSTY